MTDDIHDQAAAQLPDLADMIADTLPEGTHFALVIATPMDDENAETAHVTTMEVETMVNLLLAHIKGVIDGNGNRSEEPRSGRA